MEKQSNSKQIDVDHWVEAAHDESETDFRKAVHILLCTLAKITAPNSHFALKGGILLAIRYQGSRFTTDLDFSTSEAYSEAHVNVLLAQLESSLPIVAEDMGYGVACRIQGHKINPRPNDGEHSFITLEIRIGFARQGSKQHEKLIDGRASRIIKVDYSFYERMPNIELLNLGNDLILPAYSVHDLAAEKLRAMIQQVTRRRTRRQDAYDLCMLLREGHLQELADRSMVLESLIEKARSRDLEPTRETLDSAEIRKRSEREYSVLQSEIQNRLPPFNEVFEEVRSFYRSLPWPNSIA